MLSRRSVIIGSGLLASAWAIAEDKLPGETRARRLLGLTGRDGTIPTTVPVATRTDRFDSRTRNRRVSVITMRPQPGLPVCLLLHGRRGNAQAMVDIGIPAFLAAADRAGIPPFTAVAVDGGDTYWVARTPNDDPRAMLLTELPHWLHELGLSAPSAVLGVSMGGFGALAYAQAAGPALTATALLSPALFRSWPDARTINGFADQRQWEAHEPLRHLTSLPRGDRLGVWCGRQDPFYPSARLLADRTRPAVASFTDGAHTGGYWLRVLPDAVAYLGHRMHGTARS